MGHTRPEIAELTSYQEDTRENPNGKKTFRKTKAQMEWSRDYLTGRRLRWTEIGRRVVEVAKTHEGL